MTTTEGPAVERIAYYPPGSTEHIAAITHSRPLGTWLLALYVPEIITRNSYQTKATTEQEARDVLTRASQALLRAIDAHKALRDNLAREIEQATQQVGQMSMEDADPESATGLTAEDVAELLRGQS